MADINENIFDLKVFDEINNDLNKIIEKTQATSIQNSFCNQVDLIFEAFNKKLDENFETTLQIFKEAFNSYNNSEEIVLDEKLEISKKQKNKKNKTQSYKESSESTSLIKHNEEDLKNAEIENSEFNTQHKNLEVFINEIHEKYNILSDLSRKLKENSMKDLFIIDNNNDIFLTRMYKVQYLIKYCRSSLNLTWSKKENNEKIFTSNDDEIALNTNTCYMWFKTDKWYTSSDKSFAVEFHFKTANLINKNFHIGIQNEYITYSNMCMCTNIDHCIYLRRNGDIVCNKIPTSYSNFNFLDKTEAKILVIFNSSKKQVYFKLNEGNLLGPFSFVSGNKFRVVAGICSTFINTSLSIEKSYYLNI